MAHEKDLLLKLSYELSQTKVDLQKVKSLLDQVHIPYSENPIELTNAVLKRLHAYQERS